VTAGSGTIGAFLEQAEALPLRTVAELDLGPVLVLAPHPDDESLGCGGLLAALTATRPLVVIVSDGSGSHPGSQKFPPPRLAELRAAEARRALACLGLPEGALTLLGLPDRSLPRRGCPGFSPAVEAIAALARRHAARTICVTWRLDPHSDHEATYAMARAVQQQLPRGLRLLEYPIWGWSLPGETPTKLGPPRGFRLDIRPQLERKKAAIRAHRSQVSALVDDDPSGFRLDPSTLARFERPFEIFFDMPA
jgi:LmbE family N-acetylglucosaminyl deacetylase